MDLSRLSMGEKILGAGGIVLLISTFLPWYKWSSSGFGYSSSYSWSLWTAGNFIAFLIFLGVVAGVGLVVLRMLGILDISDQGVPEGLVVLIAAAVAGGLTLLKFLSIPGGTAEFSGEFGFEASSGRSIGAWLGLLAAAAFVVGAVMKFMEER